MTRDERIKKLFSECDEKYNNILELTIAKARYMPTNIKLFTQLVNGRANEIIKQVRELKIAYDFLTTYNTLDKNKGTK